LIGHGRSPGKRGRIRSYDELLDEIHWSIREANQVWRNARITLLGHSMGGNLALTYAAKRIHPQAKDEVTATIPIDVRAKPTKLIALAPMLRPYGKQIRDDFFRVGCKLAQWVPNWPMKMHSKPELLTTVKHRQSRYMSDKLMHRTMSIRLGIELLLSGQSLTNAQAIPMIESVLVHGTQDRLADIDASRELSRRSSNVKLVELYDELHDPLNGTDPDYVFQLIHAACLDDADSLQSGCSNQIAA
jgi:alpha-beta hydrolase superfamily lysophospholipase